MLNKTVKWISLVVLASLLLSCLSGCVNSENKKFGELTNYIVENGVCSNGTYTISRPLKDLGSVWEDDSGTIYMVYDKATGLLIFEFNGEYDGYTSCSKVIFNKDADYLDISAEDKFDDHAFQYKGKIPKYSFSSANCETMVTSFETNNAPFGEANAKATLGVAASLVLSYTGFLLSHLNIGITLKDIGFSNY